jgi:hypothetical protein
LGAVTDPSEVCAVATCRVPRPISNDNDKVNQAQALCSFIGGLDYLKITRRVPQNVSNFEHFSDAKVPVYRFISFEGRPLRQAAPSTQPIDDKNHERNHQQQMDEASARCAD